jgi:hypothetical protein
VGVASVFTLYHIDHFDLERTLRVLFPVWTAQWHGDIAKHDLFSDYSFLCVPAQISDKAYTRATCPSIQ